MKSLKHLLSALFVLFILNITPMVYAQPGASSFRIVNADPSGSCQNGSPNLYNYTNNKEWGCNNGTWTQVSGGGGGAGNISASGAVVAGCKFQVAASTSSAPYTAIGSADDCYDPAVNGATLYSGGTAAGSGGVGFTVANAAGTLTLIVLPTTTAADQGTVKSLTIGSTVTCPTQTPVAYAGIPCVSSFWTSLCETHYFPAQSTAGGYGTIQIAAPVTTTAAPDGDSNYLGWVEIVGGVGDIVLQDTVPSDYNSGVVTAHITFIGSGSGNTVAFSAASGFNYGTYNSPNAFPTQVTSGGAKYTLSVPLTTTGAFTNKGKPAQIKFTVGAGTQYVYYMDVQWCK